MNSKPVFEQTVSYLLAQVAKSHRSKAGQLLAAIDLHPGQEMVLKQLHGRCGGVAHSELADDLHVRPATVSRMVDRLEKAGLVVRCPDEDDQRVSRVRLTEQGRAREAEIDTMWQELETVTVAHLTTEERLLLRRLLLQLYENLREAA